MPINVVSPGGREGGRAETRSARAPSPYHAREYAAFAVKFRSLASIPHAIDSHSAPLATRWTQSLPYAASLCFIMT